MTDRHPPSQFAPLEYRYALDAAMPIIAPAKSPIVLCNVQQLEHEVRQRLSYNGKHEFPSAGLWIEPLAATWTSELKKIRHALKPSAPLVILVSRSLANLLPERKSWMERPLGTQPGGLSRLRKALLSSEFVLEKSYGIHSVLAITLNLMSRAAERSGRPDIGDRLQFVARLYYCLQGPMATLSTLALLFARRRSS